MRAAPAPALPRRCRPRTRAEPGAGPPPVPAGLHPRRQRARRFPCLPYALRSITAAPRQHPPLCTPVPHGPPPVCFPAGAVRVVTPGEAQQRPGARSLPCRSPRGRGDPTAQTRFQPRPPRQSPPAGRPPSDEKSAFSRANAAPHPSRRRLSGARCRAPPAAATPLQPQLRPRCGERSGAPRPGPGTCCGGARPRAPAARSGAQGGAERQGGRRGSPASPACPPAGGAPRRPVTRSGTREGTGKGAKSFKNMSHAHIKFKFTSRPPPATIGGRGAESGAAGARRERHWLRSSVSHRPGDMTDTKLLRHSLGNASP